MIIAAGLLALASVPEVFVVLWATQAGLEVVWVPLVWAAASLAKMLIAMPAGILSDRVGRVPLLLGGWALRVMVLLLLAFANPAGIGVWALFMAYSATLAVTEPAERSVIGDHAAPEERGTAFGLYHLASGLLVLPGAVIFGLIWQRFGSHVCVRRLGRRDGGSGRADDLACRSAWFRCAPRALSEASRPRRRVRDCAT